MKKVYQNNQQKRYRSARARKEARKRKHRKYALYRTTTPKGMSIARQSARRIRRAKWRTETVPRVFSIIDEPEEVVRFLDRVRRRFAEGRNVDFDLSGVEKLTAETVAVLLSRLKDGRFTRHLGYRGNVPLNQRARQVFSDSGFYRHVDTRGQHPRSSGLGEIYQRRDVKVDAAEADRLVRMALKVIPGSLAQADGIQATIIECMNNTRDHAAGGDEPERWYLSVYCDRPNRRAYFTFVDGGVGIFESLKRKRLLDTFIRFFKPANNAELLREIMEGKATKTRTDLAYRGRGLPNIARRHRMGQTQNLVIISNDVYVNVAQNVYRTMDVQFDGTLVCWEHWKEG